MTSLRLFSTILAPLLLAISSVTGVAADEKRPNILFILVDDFGARDLSCYGSDFYETPQMDRLAAEGVRFSQAYVAYPRCVPSRFAILTGKHPAALQKERDSVHVEPDRDVTFGRALQDAGYATFYCGKWHLGDGESDPDKVGFDITVAAGAAGATRSHFAPYDVVKGNGMGEKEAIVGLEDAPEGEYLADRLTEETMTFIREHKDGPFLAVLAHYAVHTPIEGKKHLAKHYAEKLTAHPLPEVLFEKESAGENLLVPNNPTYAAMVESVDNGIGRLLNLLDRLEIADNTIVVLASDHGGLSSRGGKREVATSNRPFRAGKGHLYEGGLRVPLIVRWPGHAEKNGVTIATPVIMTDLFPSFLDMAGLPLRPDAHENGISFAPLLDGKEIDSDRAFFWHNPAPRPTSTGDWFSSAIRVGNLKLLQFPTEKTTELYDLDADVGESRNLAAERPEDTARLLDQLNQWRTSVGASTEPRLRKKEQAEN